MVDAAHFDRWGSQYDQDKLHPVLVANLLDGIDIHPGARVLDMGTGTGQVAFAAAQQAGPTGEVVGVDVSAGMLTEAHRKASEEGIGWARFIHADAETVALPAESFDFVFCSSALVLMSDPVACLRRWGTFLKLGGILAFDMPAQPFGISDYAVAAAAAHGVQLPYARVGDSRLARGRAWGGT